MRGGIRCYRWRKEYGGLRLDQAKRLKELERENTRLSYRLDDCFDAMVRAACHLGGTHTARFATTILFHVCLIWLFWIAYQGSKASRCLSCSASTNHPSGLCVSCLAEEQRRRQAAAGAEQKLKKREEARPASGPIFDPYQVLGVRPVATQEEIKAVYREMMSKYHQDKLAHLMGDEFQEIANARAKAIN